MSEDEKALLQVSALLLTTGTCNSLDPEARAKWMRLRERAVIDLREMAGVES